MKNRSIIFLCTVLTLVFVLFGCTETQLLSSGMTFECPAFEKGELVLTVGDKSDGWVSPNISDISGISADDIVFVSENESVAVIEYDRTKAEVFFYYTITAVGEGETVVYAKFGDSVSVKQTVKVVSDKAETETEAETEIEAETETETKTETKAESETEREKSGMTYVLNTNSKKIHRSDCSSVGTISENNYAETDDYDSAIAEGYVPCKKCNP